MPLVRVGSREQAGVQVVDITNILANRHVHVISLFSHYWINSGFFNFFSTYGSLTKNIVILVRLDWSVLTLYYSWSFPNIWSSERTKGNPALVVAFIWGILSQKGENLCEKGFRELSSRTKRTFDWSLFREESRQLSYIPRRVFLIC